MFNKRFLGGWFHDPAGNISSKRVAATACLIQAVIATYTGSSVEMVGLWLAPAVTVLITQAITKT